MYKQVPVDGKPNTNQLNVFEGEINEKKIIKCERKTGAKEIICKFNELKIEMVC